MELEEFNLEKKTWRMYKTIELYIDNEPFAFGGFRAAYKAQERFTKRKYVVKKYLSFAVKKIENLDVDMSSHAKKQCQMHAVVRNLTQRFKRKSPKNLAKPFHLEKCTLLSWTMSL